MSSPLTPDEARRLAGEVERHFDRELHFVSGPGHSAILVARHLRYIVDTIDSMKKERIATLDALATATRDGDEARAELAEVERERDAALLRDGFNRDTASLKVSAEMGTGDRFADADGECRENAVNWRANYIAAESKLSALAALARREHAALCASWHGDLCDCGVDAHNAEVDRLLAGEGTSDPRAKLIAALVSIYKADAEVGARAAQMLDVDVEEIVRRAGEVTGG